MLCTEPHENTSLLFKCMEKSQLFLFFHDGESSFYSELFLHVLLQGAMVLFYVLFVHVLIFAVLLQTSCALQLSN